MRQRGRWRCDGATEPLERKLAVKQLGIGGGTLEIVIGLLEPACPERGPAGPIIALRANLKRFPGLGVTVDLETVARYRVA